MASVVVQQPAITTLTNTEGERYSLIQYIIDDGAELRASRFVCEYRATRRAELTELLLAAGCDEVAWRMPGETGFYQPIVVARRG